jgi:uncharacterized protein YjiS (DUF1127 family)
MTILFPRPFKLEPPALSATDAPTRFGGAAFSGVPALVRRGIETLAVWRERARSRAELAALDARQLADIGLSTADAWTEISKPFWRA